MSRQHHTSGKGEDHPDTALEEVLHEVEDAETTPEADDDARDGEPATDALSPSQTAQEDARRRAADEGKAARD